MRKKEIGKRDKQEVRKNRREGAKNKQRHSEEWRINKIRKLRDMGKMEFKKEKEW